MCHMKFTLQEVLHYSLQWIYNFHEGDLLKAHEGYSAGRDYHWNKYLGKRANEVNATQAMTEVVLNMDKEAQDLLVTWIMKNVEGEIDQQREWQDLVANREEQT